MPLPIRDFAGVDQGPANVAGPQLAAGFFALARIHIGTGGMPNVSPVLPTGVAGHTPTGTPAVYGFPGLSATLIGTGLYDIRFPPTRLAAISAQVRAPSGVFLIPNVQRGPAYSGIARLHVGGIPATSPAAGTVPQNAPTGTVFELTFLVGPTSNAPVTF